MRTNLFVLPIFLACFTAANPAQQSQSRVRLHSGFQSSEFLGESVASIGDVNRDGVDDYIVGASRHSTSLPAVGRIFAFSGATGALLYTVVGGTSGMRLGFSLARIPDQNGDGASDWVAGAPFDSSRGVGAGRVMCFSGRTGAMLWQAFGTGPDQRFGWSVAAFQRVGPGSPGGEELAVGAPGDGSVTSRFWVLSNRDGSQLGVAEAPGRHRLGTSVGASGTLIAAGAPGSGPNAEGSVRFFRFATTLTEFPPYLSFDANAGIGASITATAFTSGVNFAVGGVGIATIPGRVDLLRASPVVTTRASTLIGTRSGDSFGFSVAGGRDADGDGVPDLLIGAPENREGGGRAGAIHLYSGSTLRLNYTVLGSGNWTYGWAVAFVGDLNGDGLSELALGAPLAPNSGGSGAGVLEIASVNVRGRTELYGTACTSSVIGADANTLHVGGSILLTASSLGQFGASGVWVLGLNRTALNLGAVGMPGCFLNTTPLFTEPLQTSNTRAQLFLPLPSDPGLTNDVLRAQFALLQPGANPAGVVTSRGLQLTLGNR